MEERRFIITEKELLYFLESAMKLDMLESAGVDNWRGYGVNRLETIQIWYPESLKEEEIREAKIDFHQTALAILSEGEYEEI